MPEEELHSLPAGLDRLARRAADRSERGRAGCARTIWRTPNATRRRNFSPDTFRARSASTSTRSSDKSNPLPHMLPSPEQFAQQVGALGVGDGMTVILYDGIGLYGAARVWWTFRAFGSENVRVLDGGMPKWKAENRPLETGAAKPRSAKTFTPKFNRNLVALDRRCAESAARQDRAGSRCPRRGPLPRRSAGAARRPARRPHAGFVQCALWRSAKGRPPEIPRRPLRPRSRTPASISTIRS